jgi:hypothetical protein
MTLLKEVLDLMENRADVSVQAAMHGYLNQFGWGNTKGGYYTHAKHPGHTFTYENGKIVHKHGGNVKANLGVKGLKGYLTKFHNERD